MTIMSKSEHKKCFWIKTLEFLVPKFSVYLFWHIVGHFSLTHIIHYPDTALTSPCLILVMLSTRLYTFSKSLVWLCHVSNFQLSAGEAYPVTTKLLLQWRIVILYIYRIYIEYIYIIYIERLYIYIYMHAHSRISRNKNNAFCCEKTQLDTNLYIFHGELCHDIWQRFLWLLVINCVIMTVLAFTFIWQL